MQSQRYKVVDSLSVVAQMPEASGGNSLRLAGGAQNAWPPWAEYFGSSSRTIDSAEPANFQEKAD